MGRGGGEGQYGKKTRGKGGWGMGLSVQEGELERGTWGSSVRKED